MSRSAWWPRLATTALVAACAVSCSQSWPQPLPTHGLAPAELALRHSLGIPDDAAQVIIFAQTSHLDIDWQQTFDDYYSTFVADALIQARQVMQAQPRAFYSIAEMAYLQQHVTAHPEELAPLQALARKGAFHIVGGGMTSPDTLLPETEMLFRDLLFGVRFSEDVFGVTPRAAWLPDSFGHSGTAPDILAAAGFLSVGMSRIDGAATIYQQIFHPDLQPLPGSTAAILQEIGSSDFVWQGTSGASVLAHFIAGKGLYCEGENIDWPSDLTTPGTHIGTFQGNDPTFTDGRIDGYVQENTPYAKTPYLFVPVGCDFEAPKPQLIQYLDGYNQRRYPETGAWAVAAPFDDFGALVSYWSDVLPQLSGDLAPAYMGFFGSRPAVKRGVRDAARPFFVAESFASALGDQGAALVTSAAPQLELLTRTDHHDFVTGTSADDVVQDEQVPLLVAAQLAGESLEGEVALAVASRIPVTSGAVTRALVFNASSATRSDVTEVLLPVTGAPAALHAVVSGMDVPFEIVGTPSSTYETARLSLSGVPPWSWTMVDLLPGAPAVPSPQVTLALLDAQGAAATGAAVKRVVLSNSHVRAQFDLGSDGFALTALTLDGADVVAGPSMLPNDYQDQGGLWRLGNEMAGCTLAETPRAPGAATFAVLESTPLQVRVSFTASTYTLEASLAAGVDGLDVAITTGAAEGTTRTVSLSLVATADDPLRTSSPAGSQVRPAQHVFDPTFFPAVSWAQVGGVAVLLRQSTGVRMSTPGALELMVARDARAEQCDVMGGTGSDTSTHRIEWRLSPASTPTSAETAAQAFARPLDALLVGTAQAAGTSLPLVSSIASVSGQAVISAIKPADRGGGVIVRALLLPGPGQLQLGSSLVGAKLEQVDLTERNVQSLGTAGATIPLDAAGTGSIVGLRLY